MTVRDLFVRFGADTTGFTKGAAVVKKELNGLNAGFYENKKAMAEVNKEQKGLTAAMKAIEAEARKNKQWSADQTEQYNKLKGELNQVVLKKAQLKTEEQELRGKISASTAELKRQNTELGDTSGKSEKASNSIGRMATAVKALMLGYAGKKLTEFLIGGNAEMEQYLTSFTVMLGSADRAKALMGELTDFAAKTPLQLEDSTKAAQLLMNYGVGADSVIEKMTQLGDLSLGNAEKMNRVSLAYGQMLAKGKVTGEELRQMTEAGVPLNQALADSIGIGTAELAKMIEKGKVGIPELDKAIASLTTGNGKFAGMMAEQAKTMNGLLSTLKDNFTAFGREAGEQGFTVVKRTVSDLLSEMQKAKENGDLSIIAEEIGGAVGNTIAVLVEAIRVGWEFRDVLLAGGTALATYKSISAVVESINAFKKAQEAATLAQAAFNAASSANVYILLASAIVGATAAAVLWFDETNAVSDQIKVTGDAIRSLSEDMTDLQNGGLGGSVEGLAALNRIAETVVPKVEELGKNSNRSAGEQQLLQKYISDVNTALGYEAYAIDATTGALRGNTAEINSNIDALQRRAKSEAIYKRLTEAEGQLIDAEQNTQSAKKEMDANPSDGGIFGTENRNNKIAFDRWADAAKQQRELESIRDNLSAMYAELAEQGDTAVTSVKGAATGVAGAVSDATAQTYDDINALYEAGMLQQTEYVQKLQALRDSALASYNGFSKMGALTEDEKKAQEDALAEYTKYYKELNSIQDKAQKESVASAKAYNSELDSANKKAMSSWVSTAKKQYEKLYDARSKASEKAYSRRIKEIDGELAAEERRINGLISAIDAEIKARSRLKESTDSQKKIDAVEAQLKYAQLDEFSRRELEKELESLKSERAESDWQHAQEDRKAELQDELSNAREIAAAQKEAAQERRNRIKETLAAEKESMQETFAFISENFTSLADLKAAGINNLNDLFLFAAQREQSSVNDTFSLLSNRTLEVGALYASTVNTSIGETFDYAVERAKDAIRELNAAIREAERSASSIKRTASSSSRAESSSTNTYNNMSRVTVNKNMTDSQIERRILDTLYDPYAFR